MREVHSFAISDERKQGSFKLEAGKWWSDILEVKFHGMPLR